MPSLEVVPEDEPPKLETYQRTIFVDVDDTCLDVLGGFIHWLATMNRLKRATNKSIKDRDHLGEWLGIDDGLANLWTKEFANHSWQWGALKPFKDSNRALQAIRRHGYKIIALAHCGSELHRVILRRANLELLFPGVFNDLFAMPDRNSFYPYMKDLEDAVCITASIRTAADTAQAGHAAYLLDQPWNRNYHKLSMRRFNNWVDLANTLIQSPSTVLIN